VNKYGAVGYFFRTLIGITIVLMSTASYADAPSPIEPLPANIRGWSADWLIGTTLTLVSDTQILSMHFADRSYTAVTLGEKGGPIAGPLLSWRIESEKLFVGDAVKPIERLEFLSISANKLLVGSAGQTATYAISR
jgi:hypothetical protein